MQDKNGPLAGTAALSSAALMSVEDARGGDQEGCIVPMIQAAASGGALARIWR